MGADECFVFYYSCNHRVCYRCDCEKEVVRKLFAYGAEVLSWSQNEGWLSHPSPEEEAFWDMETAIYAEAFREARAEMRANGEL